MEQGALVHLNNETLLVRYCDDMYSVFIVPYESLCVLHHEPTTSLPRVRKTKKRHGSGLSCIKEEGREAMNFSAMGVV